MWYHKFLKSQKSVSLIDKKHTRASQSRELFSQKSAIQTLLMKVLICYHYILITKLGHGKNSQFSKFSEKHQKDKFYKINSFPKILQNAIANTSWSHALLKL